MTIVFILSVICVLVYSGILLWHFLHNKEIDGFFIVSFMYDVVYGILPALLSWEVLFDGSQSDYVQRILDLSSDGILALIYYYLYALLCFIAVTLAYYGRIKQHQLDDQRPFSEKINTRILYFRRLRGYAWQLVYVHFICGQRRMDQSLN